MHKLKEHIANLKVQLADIQTQLKPWLNKTAKQELQSQLNAIVKSSDQLTKTEVNIPSELRELKLKLIKELDKYIEAEELQAELLAILGENTSIKQPRRAVEKIVKVETNTIRKEKAVTPQFELINLINSGLLPANTKLIRHYKGVLVTGIITGQGKISITQNGISTLHNSPSSAAIALTQASQNGWTWWIVESDGRPLDYYRQQYLKQANETGR